MPDRPDLSRRSAIAGIGAVAVAAVASACTRYGGPAAPGPETTTGAPTTTGEPPKTSASGEAETTAAPAGIASTSDIPVGGGKVFADDELVITQPTEGEFKGFSAVCTHQGCTLGSVGGGTINCDTPCGHGSKFTLDGTVSEGPAGSPLAAKNVKVVGDQITLA